VFIVALYVVIDSVRKLLVTPSYITSLSRLHVLCIASNDMTLNGLTRRVLRKARYFKIYQEGLRALCQPALGSPIKLGDVGLPVYTDVLQVVWGGLCRRAELLFDCGHQFMSVVLFYR